MQTKAAIASLFLAAMGTHAAPSPEIRQAAIPLNIYDGDACGGPVISTANVPRDGSCFGISPIVSGQTDSARIDVNDALPNGCTLTLFNTNNCSPQGNNIPLTTEHQCVTFGINPLDPFIRAARVSGNCA
ncbi:hypothetical protein MFIFM68171_02216 [Madurella fahalii]|uniref:Uncharacterized protein n=1 Tax=Madurella fahalii TaxID=1157608 RepID=A0ABQ0G2L2_9PEZI